MQLPRLAKSPLPRDDDAALLPRPLPPPAEAAEAAEAEAGLAVRRRWRAEGV